MVQFKPGYGIWIWESLPPPATTQAQDFRGIIEEGKHNSHAEKSQ